MTNSYPLSRNRVAAMEQDRAAGGADMRQMRTTNGDVVTVSLSVSTSSRSSRVMLRFKRGGYTVQRLVTLLPVTSRTEALKLGWQIIRSNNIVEKEGWSWVVS
jgi:hypothetical protein